jgi:hypothetical protein
MREKDRDYAKGLEWIRPRSGVDGLVFFKHCIPSTRGHDGKGY